uniref:CSON008985 protein n=1 Tax=Culicoides sonorensis TaxID=179676 RepID=A0A336MZB4_CULSO
MNWFKVTMISFVVVFGLSIFTATTAAAPVDNLDNSINDLYEYLLQREYTGHVPLSEHQMERKAVRSPSLRLRFGRRSDPGMPLMHDDSEQGVDKRAPTARLRWGKREMGFFNENAFSQDTLRRLAQRSPSVRLRFGRSDPLLSASNNDDK